MSNLETWTSVTLGLTSALVVLLIYVWTAIGLSAVFRKSGEAGWKAWVPILNAVIVLSLGGLSGWLVLLFILPILGWIALIVAVYRINVAFGHGVGMTVLAWFFFPVWATVLGFGSARWVGREEGGRGPVRSGYADAPPLPPPPDGARLAPATFPPVAPPPAFARAASTPPATGVGAPDRPLPGWNPPPLPTPAAAPVADAYAPATRRATGDASELPGNAPAPAPPSPPVPGAAAPRGGVAHGRGLDDIPTADEPASAPLRRSSMPPATQGWDVDDDADAPSDEPSWDLDFGGASGTSEVTDAATNAPAPISAAPRRAVGPPEERVSAVPRRAVPDLGDAPEDAAEPPVTSVPTAPTPAAAMREPWAPAPSPVPSEGEAFPESSGPVSAIAGAPDAGGPRSALSSVSALHTRPHIPEEDELEATVVARRKRTAWTLVDPSGTRIPLTAEVVLIGRRPSADPDHPDAQLVSLDDDTRTVSKTHARLELRDDKWYITDLESTNGVLFTTLLGTEVAATPGEQTEAGEKFLLGDAEVSLIRSDG
ncbi:DUF5684 domain-containing protein [Microbacterium sp. BK668]|uniref:DUF5684 domain-containing protein n=1 Tax=Microbacterium sp. BK668 TaxID=2512118 RepID=UPI001061362C|nr:DUF5684 domain-containing protein [Microbacterium sp. BK668]TDN90602.1 FHA domain-containing protein [Microbacterium sp. BK668]